MKQRIRELIFLLAITAIVLPHCATNREAEPARVEPARAGADEKAIAPSAPIGSVYRVNAGNREVLVRTKRILKMGERVYAEVGDAKAVMEATFPMLTSSKCTLEASSRKYFGRLVKGMPVYAYVPGEKKARSEPKAGDSKTIGGMEFVYIPAGSFIMGQPDPNIGYKGCSRGEQPVHRVSVDGFWMGSYEVTQGQYEAVMGINPSHFIGDGRRPVERVTWNQAVAFCTRFGAKLRVTVRLPTEAEWEYAARAGSETLYYWGDRIDGNYLWYYENAGGTTHRVGEKSPNAFRLYDMSGNAWEWCADWYDEKYYARSPEKNPKGPEGGQDRVLRGGSCCGVLNVRSAFRSGKDPGNWVYYGGFRVVVPAGGK